MRRLETMKNIIKARKATSSVFAVLLIIIITIAFGIIFLNFVLSEVDFMKNTFNTQISGLVLKTFTINSTHITAWLQNGGIRLTKITGAYVNGLVAALPSTVQVEPSSTTVAYIKGTFIEGNMYAVELLSLFKTVITFEIAY